MEFVAGCGDEMVRFMVEVAPVLNERVSRSAWTRS
jgi:hypothetical protein